MHNKRVKARCHTSSIVLCFTPCTVLVSSPSSLLCCDCVPVWPKGGCILAVAVVKNSSEGLDMRSLQGRRSCHSGARWTAGWSLPLGHLLSRNLLPWPEEQPFSQGNTDASLCIKTPSTRTPVRWDACSFSPGPYVQFLSSDYIP